MAAASCQAQSCTSYDTIGSVESRGLGLGSHPHHLCFGDEGCLFKLDLISDSIHCEISAICKGDVVLFPFLSDIFSTELFKNFAFVVFAIFNSFKEELRGADQFGALRQEKNFLFIRGIETESITGAAGSGIKSEDVGKNFACSNDRVKVAFEVKAEDVIVSVGEFVVAVDKVVEEVDVSHF